MFSHIDYMKTYLQTMQKELSMKQSNNTRYVYVTSSDTCQRHVMMCNQYYQLSIFVENFNLNFKILKK